MAEPTMRNFEEWIRTQREVPTAPDMGHAEAEAVRRLAEKSGWTVRKTRRMLRRMMRDGTIVRSEVNGIVDYHVRSRQ